MTQHNTTAPQEEILGEAMTKTEHFIEKNGRTLTYTIAAAVVVAGAIFGYRSLVMQPRETNAQQMMYVAQERFEAAEPEYQLILDGDAEGAGLLEVIENYGSTKAGNLAKHYAGISYLKLGDLENAASYLADFKPVKGIAGEIVNAQNLGLQGDIAVVQDDFAAAIKLYNKAVAASENNLTAPSYLLKGALAAIAAGDKAAAKEMLESIKNDYPQSFEVREADKYLGTL